jgi:hypothetical protein
MRPHLRDDERELEVDETGDVGDWRDRQLLLDRLSEERAARAALVEACHRADQRRAEVDRALVEVLPALVLELDRMTPRGPIDEDPREVGYPRAGAAEFAERYGAALRLLISTATEAASQEGS